MEAETATSSENAKPVNPGRVPSGQRLNEMLEYLMKERVGSELIFNAEHSRQVNTQFGIHPNSIKRTLRNLESKGIISCKKLPGDKEMQITFLDKSNKPKVNGQPKGKRGGRTIEEIRQAVEYDIIGLEAQIEAKKKFLAELDSYTKSSAYAKLMEKKEA